jgi:hypothetical protein
MKKLIYLLVLALVVMSCDNSNEPKTFSLDPNAKIYIKASETKAKAFQAVKSKSEHLTALEVVKQADVLVFYNKDLGDSYAMAMFVGKDTVSNPPALLRWATDIIYDTDGYGHYGLTTEFINGHDFVICRGNAQWRDTIAYIPNAVMFEARRLILESLANKDTVSVYIHFQNAFRFIPITGPEYEVLKARGEN